MELRERIKIARKAAGYKSQEKLAEFLGTTRPAIMSYEMGRVVPNDVFLQLMATKLGISYEWLKSGAGEMRQPPAGLDAILSGLEADDVEIVQIYAELPPEHRRILKDFARKVAETGKQQAPAPQPAAYTDEELAAYEKVKAIKEQEADPERAALHAELDAALDEKEGASAASGSSGSARKQA